LKECGISVAYNAEQLPEVVIAETFNEKREHAPAVKLKEF
jgi:hypothetical protein